MIPDTSHYPPIEYRQFNWLLKAGVPVQTLISLMPIRCAVGRRAEDGIFEDVEGGDSYIVFEEFEDNVFWSPRTGEIATSLNRAFALGEGAIDNAGTYAFDCHLYVFPDPLAWLRSGCDGCVVLDWSRAFDRLRDAPRIAVDEDLRFLFERHMRPRHMPDVSVIINHRRAAA